MARRVSASAGGIANLAVGIAAGTVGGLAAGYIASWLYRSVLGFVPESVSSITAAEQSRFSQAKEFNHVDYEVVYRADSDSDWSVAPTADALSATGQAGEFAYRDAAKPDVVMGSQAATESNSASVRRSVGRAAYKARVLANHGQIVNPGAMAALNPLIGLVALMLLNAVAIMLVLWLVPGLLSRPMAGSVFMMSLFVIELDDLIVLSNRILAPLGGDPLVSGRDSRYVYANNVERYNAPLGGTAGQL